jgi:hypothetical protein
MAVEPAPYFEVHLEHLDGTKIPPERFPTVAHAMAAAEEHRDVAGAILFYREPGADPVEMIVYNADGTIEVGAGAPDNDEFEDEPWTDEEIAANFAASRELTAAERAQAVIAALDTHLEPAEARIAERMLREYGGTIPDTQLIEEIGLAIAVHRRQHKA